MAKHTCDSCNPNRNPRSRSVYVIRDTETGVKTERVIADLTNTQAMAAAKKAAGAGAVFVAHYGPTSFAYVGAVTAVVSW